MQNTDSLYIVGAIREMRDAITWDLMFIVIPLWLMLFVMWLRPRD